MNKLIKVEGLKKYFPVKRGLFYKTVDWIKAVDEVSFCIDSGKTLGLVGESGCGKSTLAKVLVRLIEPDEGQVFFDGREVTKLAPDDLRRLRRDLQIIFQDPFSSLDPRFTVEAIINEGLRALQSQAERGEAIEKVYQILELVGLPRDSLKRFPHEFSGGQRQRISIARSLVLKPKFLVLDEPVSSLDVSIQAQIINLLYELQEKLGLSYLFISHDLHVVKAVSDAICVMYSGKVMEQGPSRMLLDEPLHPYTRLLRDSSLGKAPAVSQGERVDNAGCVFRPRCQFQKNICKESPPFFFPHQQRRVACWLFS